MDDDWYNASLPRYPRVLIQREQNTVQPMVSHAYQRSGSGSNVIRIRVHGGRVVGEDNPPRVSVHQYTDTPLSPTNQVSAETVRSGVATPLPVQIRHMTSSPVMVNTAGAQQVTIPIAHVKGPMKAVPLSHAHRQDYNSNRVNQPSMQQSSLMSRTTRSPSPSMSRITQHNDNFFGSFEKEFDRLTSEFSRQGPSKPTMIRTSSNLPDHTAHQIRDYSHYSSRRHASDDLTARQRQASGPTSPHYRQSSHPQPLIRESSPGIFTSSINTRREGSTPRSFSRERSLPPSGPTSPRETNSSSNRNNVPPQTGDRTLPTVTRAKWVLDKVLRNLVSKDALRPNRIVGEARETIQRFSDGLDRGKHASGDDADSGYSGSGDTTKTGFTLSSVEIRERIRKYNDSNRHSKMTEEQQGETFLGDIQICMCLEQPVDMLLNTRPASILHSFTRTSTEEEKITASATIPENTITKLHISSEDSTDEVVQQLLDKFSIKNNLKCFSLFEQTLEDDCEVKLRKIAGLEKPLLNFLRWKTESQEKKRFVLRESHNTEIMWEAFSLPELSNFLSMLQLEHQNQVETIRNKYIVYRRNVEERLRELDSEENKT